MIKRLIYRLMTANNASLQWRDCLTAIWQGRACAVAKVANLLRCRARCWWAVLCGKDVRHKMYMEVCSPCQYRCTNCLHSGAIQAHPGYNLSLDQLRTWISATQRSGYFFREVWINGPGEPLLWRHLDAGLQMLRDSGVCGAIIIVSNGQAMGRVSAATWHNIDLMFYDVYPADTAKRSLPESRIYRMPVAAFRSRVTGRMVGTIPAKCICHGPMLLGGRVWLHCGPVMWDAARLAGADPVAGSVEVAPDYLRGYDQASIGAMPLCEYCDGNETISAMQPTAPHDTGARQ
jgi:hypothetical protein